MKQKKQATAPPAVNFGTEAFEQTDHTALRWLGGAGMMLNSRGTCVMVDPVLEGFDMPLLIDMPIHADQVPHLDAVLLTHADNDHFSRSTCQALQGVCPAFHGPHYVATLLEEMDLPGIGHQIGDSFRVGAISAKLTPADHAWQNEYGGYDRVFLPEDFCGYWIDTPDGSVWIPGDSRLMEQHLHMASPRVILFDFSDHPWHIGFNNAITLANAYPQALLLLSHWGTVDAPDMTPFNADPADLAGRVQRPERIRLLAPGEALVLQ